MIAFFTVGRHSLLDEFLQADRRRHRAAAEWCRRHVVVDRKAGEWRGPGEEAFVRRGPPGLDVRRHTYRRGQIARFDAARPRPRAQVASQRLVQMPPEGVGRREHVTGG